MGKGGAEGCERGSERRVAEWCGAQGGWRWRDISFNLNETRINDVKSVNSIRRALLIQHD